jgi:2-keto-4-pentenoate hydratase/2-oxohepta-3-ene-1,7-dioic acid hydratase in catechol pathway
LLAPIPLPRTIYCAGANYTDHIEEMMKKSGQPMPPDPHTLGLKSWHFIKVSSCVTGPNVPVKLPAHSKTVDWEIELAVVIGKTCKDATMQNALSFVAGYTIGNDLSARDNGPRPNLPPTSPFKYDWVAHKCFDQSNPLGPWIAPADFIKDPQNLSMKLSINGVLKQNSNSKFMIYNIAEQIVHLSGRLTLHPGDIIMTGTPAGVGMPNNEFLKPGDVVTVSIEGIGEMINSYV